MNAREALKAVLLAAEDSLRRSMAECTDPRIPFFEFLRSADSLYVPTILERVPVDPEVDSVLALGIPEMLLATFRDFSGMDGIPLMPSSSSIRRWSLSAWRLAGTVGMTRHWLELDRLGLAVLEIIDGRFVFRLVAQYAGVEQWDVTSNYWLSGIITAGQAPLRPEFERRRPAVQRIMANLVAPWRKHFIQYGAHPLVDEYYLNAGLAFSQFCYGTDEFPADTTFGGYEYNEYRGAVGSLLGNALKHADFCQTLKRLHPRLDYRNIFTIFRTRDEILQEVQLTTGSDRSFAEAVLELMSLTVGNVGYHCEQSGMFPAPLYARASRRMYFRPLFGPLVNPFAFMLGELRRRHRGDWDRAVALRERRFRADLYSLFSIDDRYFCVDSPIKLRSRKRTVTDVDAVVFDRVSGTIGLFQLKWQDPFGSSMRVRESKRTNLVQTAQKWLESVKDWLAEGVDDLHAALGLSGQRGAPINGVRLFVLTRHATHFSGSIDYTSDGSAWGTWPQVLRVAAAQPSKSDRVDHLYRDLVEDSPFRKPTLNPQPITVKILDTDVTFAEVKDV